MSRKLSKAKSRTVQRTIKTQLKNDSTTLENVYMKQKLPEIDRAALNSKFTSQKDYMDKAERMIKI